MSQRTLPTSSPASRDTFGNILDPTVGYAQGKILRSSDEETLKTARAEELIRNRVDRLGPDSIYVFTGMECRLGLETADLATLAQEAFGPALFGEELRARALEHMGGGERDEVAVLNRTSGAIVSACLALCRPGDTIVSLVPGAISHPSVKRGAQLAGAELIETTELDVVRDRLKDGGVSLVMITGVTSEQLVISESDLRDVIELVRAAGCVSMVDDAYGARVRTVLFDQPPARAMGADLAVTSVQKAGLNGPRAGLLVGKPPLVQKVLSAATRYGMEARGPLTLGVLRSLERYRPENLLADVGAGAALHSAMTEEFGEDRVVRTALGPVISQDDALSIALERSTGDAPPVIPVVPAEATAALGMLLLEHHGILTVNAAGAPGARVSLRLKATANTMERAGGAIRVVAAVKDGFNRLARVIGDADAIRGLVLPG